MITYQLGDQIKTGVHLREDFMVSGPLPLFQTYEIVPSILV